MQLSKQYKTHFTTRAYILYFEPCAKRRMRTNCIYKLYIVFLRIFGSYDLSLLLRKSSQKLSNSRAIHKLENSAKIQHLSQRKHFQNILTILDSDCYVLGADEKR
jgi:hypothetical protein